MDSFYSNATAVARDRLKHNFCGSTVEAIADGVIETHGTLAFREIDAALNAWRLSWHSRKFRDYQSDGKLFSADPMPFWHLAKLFIVLHLLGDEQGAAGCSDLKLPKARVGDTKSKQLVQEKIISWMRRFGTERTDRQDLAVTTTTANELSAAEQEGSRVLLLMKPL